MVFCLVGPEGGALKALSFPENRDISLPEHSGPLARDWPLLSLSHPHQLSLPIRRLPTGLLFSRGTEMRVSRRMFSAQSNSP